MRTIRIKAYKFEELSDKAKEQAIKDSYDINVNYEWWDSTYEDAERIGLKLDSFDLDRNLHATGDFINGPLDVAIKIMAEHGEMCETYKTAAAFQLEYADLVEKYSDSVKLDIVAEENEYEFDQEADDLEDEFLKDLLSDYATMLQNESEYLQSEEAISETLISNEYEFTADGKYI